MTLSIDTLNAADPAQAVAWLDGIYEHSPWVAQAALAQRPWRSLQHLKSTLTAAVTAAPPALQLALIRAHPELAGQAMVQATLSADSTHEQAQVGLTQCTEAELTRLRELNAAYSAKFGFPFVLAVRGPRGTGLLKQEIIATFERRLQHPVDFEQGEALRNIHRIAELRLNQRWGQQPTLGNQVWDWQEQLAQHSEPGYAEQGQLTVTYLSDAHRACAAQIAQTLRECGFDSVHIDAVGNVVGRYEALSPEAPTLLTGSHYDTVRNGGKYDGRLGIFVPVACVRELHHQQRRLPFAIEVVGFAEEEGQRYKAVFLGSGALIGDFNTAWLDQQDAQGISMRQAMAHAGHNPDHIAALQRDPARYLGFVEVHIEQGPVLNELNLPLGVVSSINGAVRYVGEVIGMASHSGTTPMNRRRDAACAVAELLLYAERRAAQEADAVATVGMLHVPNGSINVVPGLCTFSLDVRAPVNALRDAVAADVLAELARICQRRGLNHRIEEAMRAAAAPSDPHWQRRWENALHALDTPVHRMPSGAGHDAMKLHEVMPQAMLFVRGQNSGISHNPLESTTSDDMQLAVQAFAQLLEQLAQSPGNSPGEAPN